MGSGIRASKVYMTIRRVFMTLHARELGTMAANMMASLCATG